MAPRRSGHHGRDRHRRRSRVAVPSRVRRARELTWPPPRPTPPRMRAIANDDPIPGVKDVVLVMSGKGGVGKSTVAASLALSLKRLGKSDGLLDADMYGPSVPTMFGISGRPLGNGTKIQPLTRFDVKLMSVGFLLEDEKAAVVWRGPMLHGA